MNFGDLRTGPGCQWNQLGGLRAGHARVPDLLGGGRLSNHQCQGSHQHTDGNRPHENPREGAQRTSRPATRAPMYPGRGCAALPTGTLLVCGTLLCSSTSRDTALNKSVHKETCSGCRCHSKLPPEGAWGRLSCSPAGLKCRWAWAAAPGCCLSCDHRVCKDPLVSEPTSHL